MASPSQWTWVWASSRSWWWTGKPGLLQSMGSQRVGHDWATELNWCERYKQSTTADLNTGWLSLLLNEIIWQTKQNCNKKLLGSVLRSSALVGLSSEKAMATHSSTLAWKIPWMEGAGGLQSMGSLGVGHDWATSLSLFTFRHWRRKWQPTPVFLPGESQGPGSLVGCRLWGRTESDTTEAT